MADDSKKPALPTAEETPQIKSLRARRDNLIWRRDNILAHQEPSEAHDIETAKKRTQNGIDEIDAELKRLGATK